MLMKPSLTDRSQKNMYKAWGFHGLRTKRVIINRYTLLESSTLNTFHTNEIARGLSPFKPEKAAIESGRIMLRKIKQNIKHQIDFAFETTLATKGYVNTIEYSREYGYKATLLFFLA